VFLVKPLCHNTIYIRLWKSMRNDSLEHVNVLIHWGVYGNSTFRLHARGSPSRDGPSPRKKERKRGRERNTLNPTAMLYARPNVITRTAAAAATRLRICFWFVFEPAAAGVFSSLAAACRRGHRARPHSITRSVSPSSTRARTSALEEPASIYFAAVDDRENATDLFENTVPRW